MLTFDKYTAVTSKSIHSHDQLFCKLKLETCLQWAIHKSIGLQIPDNEKECDRVLVSLHGWFISLYVYAG